MLSGRESQAPPDVTIPPRGRVVLECATCAVPVSWPVSGERLRRGESPSGPPEAGLIRLVNDPALVAAFVTSLASARLDTSDSIKMARACQNGHYVAKARTSPHPAPHQVEFPARVVTVRLLDDQ